MSTLKIIMNWNYLDEDLLDNKKFDAKLSFDVGNLYKLIESNIQSINLAKLNLIDLNLLEEIKEIENCGESFIYIGKTLRDIKCIIQDYENVRRHEVFIQYKEPKKLRIINTSLPYTNIQDNEYSSIRDIIIAYKKYINDLSCYLYELELIDQQCAVMEPVHPTYKDDYRRILIDGRTWLHVEVTQEGLATNIHLMGQSQLWQNKLQEGLLSWDHDKNIVTNIMTIFDASKSSPQSYVGAAAWIPKYHIILSYKCHPLSSNYTDLAEFPQIKRQLTFEETGRRTSETLVCSICLCTELPDIPNIPLPLCQNLACGVYFHRHCLYEWLVTSESRPVFGVATGSCPSCLQPIVCNEIDT